METNTLCRVQSTLTLYEDVIWKLLPPLYQMITYHHFRVLDDHSCEFILRTTCDPVLYFYILPFISKVNLEVKLKEKVSWLCHNLTSFMKLH